MFKEYEDRTNNFLVICCDCCEEFNPGEQIFHMSSENSDNNISICSKCA